MKGIIYKIINKQNGLIYIGQTTTTLKRRWQGHKSALKSQIHHNELLQRAYNKYGIEPFEIFLIERCNIEELDERERYWINYYDSTNRSKGYNFESGGNKLKKHSPETIEKFILHSRGENNKLTSEQVIEIKKSIIAGETLTEIGKKYNVSISCIYRIKKLENWKYVAPELNEAVINTDTSRKIKRLTLAEIEKCKKLVLEGESVFLLAQQYEIPYGRFLDMFKSELESVKSNLDTKKEIAITLFFQNYSINEILKRTGLSYAQYKRATSGLIEIRRERNIKYVVKAKSEGKTNSVIAKELNVNRCTITVYLKEYNKNMLIPC